MDPLTIAALLYATGQGVSSYSSSRDQRKAREASQKASKLKKFDTLNPRQESYLRNLIRNLDPSMLNIGNNQSYQAGSDYLNNLLSGNPEATAAFEAPYMRQFNEEIIPQLATQFSGLGAQNSSAFRQALGQQAAGLTERLAALRSGLQMQALPQALQYARAPSEFGLAGAQMALGTPTFGYTQKGGPAGSGGWQSTAAQGVGSGLNAYALYSMMNAKNGTPQYQQQTWNG